MVDPRSLVQMNPHSSECTLLQSGDKLYRITRIRASGHRQTSLCHGWKDHHIQLPETVTEKDILGLIRLLNPWIYGFERDVQLSALISPAHLYKFNSLALTRKIPCLKEFEGEVIDAIQRSASVHGLGWIPLGLKHQVSSWLVQGCTTFLSAPPACRSLKIFTENGLSADALLKLYRIKDLFDYAVENEEKASVCYYCHRLVILQTTEPGTWLRTCTCRQTVGLVGLKPYEHMEEVLKEIVVDIFTEKYGHIVNPEDVSDDTGDVAVGRKKRKVQF